MYGASGIHLWWAMQAEQLSEVLAREGPDFLATWRPPMLTWAELQQLKAEAPAGNALEAALPGERLRDATCSELVNGV